MKPGFVYALVSAKTPWIKIGRSDRLPPLRLKEINKDKNYSQFSPWKIHDFIHVTDAVAAETFIHRSLRDRQVRDVSGAIELFNTSQEEATDALSSCPEEMFVSSSKLKRLSFDHDLSQFLKTLFRISGLDLMLEHQGIWTFSLYPSTSGGRLFTINIGQHEVAYALDPRGGTEIRFVFALDKLFPMPIVKKGLGRFFGLAYASSSGRLRMHSFKCNLQDAAIRIQSDNFRRALVAYWMDHLIRCRDANSISIHARHHNANAVRTILGSASGNI